MTVQDLAVKTAVDDVKSKTLDRYRGGKYSFLAKQMRRRYKAMKVQLSRYRRKVRAAEANEVVAELESLETS